MLEKIIEKELSSNMKKIGGACHKFVSPSNNGMPDRICIFPNGAIYFVETKRPKGGRLSKVQAEQHRRLWLLRHEVQVIWTIRDLMQFFEDRGYYEQVSAKLGEKYGIQGT